MSVDSYEGWRNKAVNRVFLSGFLFPLHFRECVFIRATSIADLLFIICNSWPINCVWLMYLIIFSFWGMTVCDTRNLSKKGSKCEFSWSNLMSIDKADKTVEQRERFSGTMVKNCIFILNEIKVSPSVQTGRLMLRAVLAGTWAEPSNLFQLVLF